MARSAIQPALITGVIPNSIGAELGFEPGDRLVAINQQRPRDLIDYRFLCADEVLELEVLDRLGQTHILEIEKDGDEDLGLEFESALFDGLIQCNNHCPFCFIDQQPPGKRSSLYLKDDDYRLSFLYGSYLTLTNLPPREWQRIEQLRLSPLYVSVHATDPEVRRVLLANPKAPPVLPQLAWFQARRLQVHAQVVVCPGINDGPVLERTLLDLIGFHQPPVPTVASVAVVPVGLTRYRPPGSPLQMVDPTLARQVISLVQPIQEHCLTTLGSRTVWLADEWFLTAGWPLPPAAAYEDYPQLGNGVGSIRRFLNEFEAASKTFPARVHPQRHFTWVVGNAVAEAFAPICERLATIPGLQVDLIPLRSDYWGQQITVTGLLTGQDLLEGLRGRTLGETVIVPAVMLKPGDDCFLDDMQRQELAQALGVPILAVTDLENLLATLGLR